MKSDCGPFWRLVLRRVSLRVSPRVRPAWGRQGRVSQPLEHASCRRRSQRAGRSGGHGPHAHAGAQRRLSTWTPAEGPLSSWRSQRWAANSLEGGSSAS